MVNQLRDDRRCPHCTSYVMPATADHGRVEDMEDNLSLGLQFQSNQCPACQRTWLVLLVWRPSRQGTMAEVHIVWPRTFARPVATEVPVRYADYFREAAGILSLSPRASAALSRRCLQELLRGEAGAKGRDLAGEIESVLEQGGLPSYLAGSLDTVRQIGNFGAHPNKSTRSGEIIDVEVEEAAWNLDVLQGLFDFYFVQREATRQRLDRLNEKLEDAGKTPLKVEGLPEAPESDSGVGGSTEPPP